MEMMLEQFKTIFDRPEKVKKLREMILDLAVRGKLVEQDPNDEPASVLLKRIKEEKERLIKEKKIKKEKALAEISDEEKPFELPDGWEWARLGDIGNIFNGNSINTKIKDSTYSRVEFGYNYLSTKDFSFNGRVIGYNTGIKIPYNENKFKIAHNGAVLICSEGGSAGKKIGIIDEDICFGNKMYAIEPIEVLSKYICYIYQSSVFFKTFSDKMTGIIGGISIANFKNICIPVCSMSEQKRIVQKVDFLMSFCDKLEEALEKKVHYGELCAKSIFNSIGNVSTSEELEEALKFILANFKDISLGDNAVKELKNCILQLAVQGKLVEQDPNDEPASVLLEKISEEKERLIKEKKIKKEKALAEIREEEKPFELPDGWCFTRLNNLTTKIGAGSTPKGGKSVYLDSGIKFIRSQNVYNNGLFINDVAYIDEKTHEKMSGSKVEANDLLINITGGSIGRCCIVPSEFDTGNVNQHVSIVRLIDNEILKYIHLVLTSPYIFNKIMEVQVGISREGLSISKLSEFIIPFPPLSEQKRIVEKVDSLMALCDELENKIQEQKKYSNMLMESILKNSFSK